MHLCFGSFSMLLLNCKKNNALTKIVLGRTLLSFIRANYADWVDDRYIYYFLDQRRELPKGLKDQMTDLPVLIKQFSEFVEKYLFSDHQRIVRDMRLSIQEDTVLPEHEKSRLLQLSKELALPAFLAALFVYIVDNTNNKKNGIGSKTSKRHFTLREKIERTTNNKVLLGHAKAALQEKDVVSLTFCLHKMTNNVYMAQFLILAAENDSFVDGTEYMQLWHATCSRLENDRYRYLVFEACLKSGYFREYPEQLLDIHMQEYVNNRYLFDTLILLCKLDRKELAIRYSGMLTNRLYRKRFREYLMEMSISNNTD